MIDKRETRLRVSCLSVTCNNWGNRLQRGDQSEWLRIGKKIVTINVHSFTGETNGTCSETKSELVKRNAVLLHNGERK